MIKCEQARILLSKYVDCETDAMETDLVNEHVRACFWCKNELEELGRFKAALAGKERKAFASDYLVCRLHARMARGEEREISLSGLGDLSRRFLPVPLAVIAVTAFSLFVLHWESRGNGYQQGKNMVSASLATRQAAWNLLLGAHIE